MDMTKERLEKYRSCKAEIEELDYLLQHLRDEDGMIGNSVIMDYRTGYPRPQSVVGFDQKKYQKRRDHYIKQKLELIKECEEVEEFVEAIPVSLTRRIFRMYFIQGFSQQKISQRVHLSQAGVSKTINKYLDIMKME